MIFDDLPLTINETQERLVNKSFSALELTESYLNRIDKFDKDINSFITITSDLALNQAKKVDKIIGKKGSSALREYPLLGVSIAHKDMFMTKGILTTAASKVLEDYKAQYSATIVTRLENAGVIMLGKNNCDAWAHGSSGENSDFGATLNPWNKNYVPGGSSSGSAASVAAGFTLLSTGTDTCGSIRLPASFCGISGLKPTYGSVSRYGVIAMASSLDSVGHFARSVEDIEKVYEVTSGTDGFDSTLSDTRIAAKKLKGLKIGLPEEFFIDGVDSQIAKAIKEAQKIFEGFGIEFKKVSLPKTKHAISVYYIIQPAEVSSNLGRYDGVRYGRDRLSFGEEAKRRIMLGTYVLSAGYYDAYYNKAMKVRTLITEELDSVYKEVDVLMAPVSPTPPFKLGAKVDNPLEMYLSDIFAATANLTGTPGLAIPAGFTDIGLPIGFQLMGPRFSEFTLFELGRAYQSKTDFHLKTPKLA